MIKNMIENNKENRNDNINKNINIEEMTSKDYYFDSYSHFGIHEEMLKDTIRTRSYMNAILYNKHLFKDKIILDVGCGTGILSMFAAKSGAKHVYGVDCSNIIIQAKEIIKNNHLDTKITLIKGKIEEITLPVNKVDIIISEWMGYFLLYESMLDSVLFARDKWLIHNGIIFPDRAILYITSLEDAEYKAEKIDFWDDVYGFDMSCIKKLAMMEPLVDMVSKEAIISNSCPILDINILKIKKNELSFISNFQLNFKRKDICHGLVAYFDCFFELNCHKKISFSTGPFDKYTHWKQTIFYLNKELLVNENEILNGTLTCCPNKENPRDLDITISIDFKGKDTNSIQKQEFRLR